MVYFLCALQDASMSAGRAEPTSVQHSVMHITFFLPERADARRYGKEVIMTLTLPSNASLEQLKRQAKDLVKQYQARDPEALRRVHSASGSLSLSQAQHVLA